MCRKGLMALLAIAVFAMVFAGRTDAAPRFIGVSLLTREHDFFRRLESGLLAESTRRGLRVDVEYAEFDHDRQVSQVRAFIARKADAIVLAPCDSTAIGDAILAANKAGIPVFTVDIANASGKGRVVAHIASDNLSGGRQAGVLMAKALKGTGKVVIINHPKVTSVMDRVAGFREYLTKYPGIDIVAEIPAWGQRDRAMAIMEDLLLMMPDLKGVFAINDDSALGAARAVVAAGRTGEIVIVGYDATPEARKAIDSGQIFGDVVQNPAEIGRLAAAAIDDHFRGRVVRPFIAVPVGVYTR